MTSIIRILPLSGAKSTGPPCYLLQLDRFRFLLDCGLTDDSTMAPDYLRQLEPHIRSIDAVLLSHPDTLHLGALPILFGKMGLSCPVYATTPVYLMGQMFLYDLYQSRKSSEDFSLFTLDDVDGAFEKVVQLKYSQSTMLKGRGRGISITPLPAGHMIGGTIWRILKDGEEDIIYAIDYNHKKERHLNGCFLEGFPRASLFITDAYNAAYRQSKRTERDELLITRIMETLSNRGNVLIAVDTAGRVLEIAYMLEQFWRNSGLLLAQFPLIMLNNFSYNVMEFAKSHVEWMSGAIMKSFEGQRNNPFSFQHLKLCHKLQELARFGDGPKVVLAAPCDLECGYSRELFIDWMREKRNLIIFTQRPNSTKSLAHQIITNYRSLYGRVINIERRIRIPLEGLELEEFRIKQEAERQAKVQRSASGGGDDDQSSESDSDDSVTEASTLNSSASKSISKRKSSSGAGQHDLMTLSKPHGAAKSKGFFKQVKKSYPMYPCIEERMTWDDYGERLTAEELAMFDRTNQIAQLSDPTQENNENMDTNRDIKTATEPEEREEMPTKCISRLEAVPIQAQIQMIDLEGLCDGDSMKKILSMIKPRQLVILRGGEEACESLADHCRRNNIVTDRIFTPGVGELVDATTESSIYQVRLNGTLMSSLTFSRAKDGAELAWIEGRVTKANSDENATKLTRRDLTYVSEAVDADELPILEPCEDKEAEKQIAGQSHPTIFINELKLSDLKQVLIRARVDCEFSGGVLHCAGDKVAIRRTEAGKITLEGTLCSEYFQVRQLLYSQYAII